ncbi:MAG: ABC transporter transmembrane domain-containing protein [Candidatus Odinarchaeota archaeon]
MSSDKQANDNKEEDIIKPSASTRQRFMLEGDKSVLDHPRRKLWRWMISYLKPQKFKFFLFFFFLLLSTIISTLNPIFSANIIDKGIVAQDSNYVVIMCEIFLILIIIMSITNYFALYGMGKISQKVTFQIRNDLFYKLQDMSLNYYDKRSSGQILSTLTNDVTLLNQLVGGQLVQIISSMVSIGLTIIFMFFLNSFLALISMIIFPIFFIITRFFRNIASTLFKEERKTIGKVTSSIQENIEGARVVKAYGQEKRAVIEFDQANTANYKISVKIRNYMATIFPLTSLTTTIITATIILVGGFVTSGNISFFGITVSVGVLSAFITILGQFFRPFMTLMQIKNVIESALAASDRIYLLLEEKVEIPDIKNPILFEQINGSIEINNISFGYILNNNGKIENKFNKKGLESFVKFDNTINSETILKWIKFLERILRVKANLQQSSGFSGEGEGMISNKRKENSPQTILETLAKISIPPEINERIPKIVKDAINEQKILLQHTESKGYILKDFSLKIPAGITLAIVGETGAGKTTLIKLIARFYDINEGKILVDDIDITRVKKKDLRDLIGIVPQDAFLFTGTIRDNILYGYEDISPELEKRMIEVSEFLGLHNFIEALHNKYDTKLKENGSNISIGQRQLIAFARALITDPKILILDEATSSVDPYTETLIQDALNKARKGRTTIIIAHRLSTIKNADHIIVLDANKRGIIEQGTHERLIALNGKYKNLLEMQHRDIEYKR